MPLGPRAIQWQVQGDHRVWEVHVPEGGDESDPGGAREALGGGEQPHPAHPPGHQPVPQGGLCPSHLETQILPL